MPLTSREREELVTKEFLRAEMSELRAELRAGMAALEVRITEKMRHQTIVFTGTLASSLIAGMGLAAMIV